MKILANQMTTHPIELVTHPELKHINLLALSYCLIRLCTLQYIFCKIPYCYFSCFTRLPLNILIRYCPIRKHHLRMS